MLETLLNAGVTRTPPVIPVDNTNWPAIRDRYAHNTMISFSRSALTVGTGAMAIYGNRAYYCNATNIIEMNLLNDFSVTKTITYGSVKPSFGLNDAQYVVDQILYVLSGANLSIINVLTGAVTKVTAPVGPGAILVSDRRLYIINNSAGNVRVYNLDTGAWSTQGYTGTTSVDVIAGGNAMPYGDVFIISGGSKSPGGDYSVMWTFDPITNHMSSTTLSIPIIANYHNPVAVFDGNLYQYLSASGSSPGSRKFDMVTGEGTIVPQNITNFYSAFTGKYGVLVMKSYYRQTIEILIID